MKPEGFLNQKVELMEDIGQIKKGAIGLCTADLEGEVFAVKFPDYGWISFHPNSERDKFEIYEGLTNDEEMAYVRIKIDSEGFDYTFMHYSDFKDIKDAKFHELRLAYIKATKDLSDYLKIPS